jgi:hypothetical protein
MVRIRDLSRWEELDRFGSANRIRDRPLFGAKRRSPDSRIPHNEVAVSDGSRSDTLRDDPRLILSR